MDRKILILSITLVVIILFLSFRKEGFSTAELESARTSEEEDIGEVEVPPGLNISDFLQKLELMKDEKKKNEETLDALYDANRDDNQDSPEQASEAIQGENETQYAFLKDFVDGAQQTEQEIRDDARTQVNAELEAIVMNQAEDYFSTKDTGFDDVPKKKGIVKVDNSSFDSFAASLAAALDITTYGATNIYGDGDQFHKAIVPRCHKRPTLAGGEMLYWETARKNTTGPGERDSKFQRLPLGCSGGSPADKQRAYEEEPDPETGQIPHLGFFFMDPPPPACKDDEWVDDTSEKKCGSLCRVEKRRYDLAQPEWSCLNSDGVPGDVGEDGFVVDSFEQCASKCLANDKCSGFSVVPDSTFPDEGFGLTCKLTHHEFEDSKEVPGSTNEQVFAVHENDYLKNPLYNALFTARKGASGPYAARRGSDNHIQKKDEDGTWISGGASGTQCFWRSSCNYSNFCAVGKMFPEFVRDSTHTGTGSGPCKDGVKIENNGMPRDCEGTWDARVKGGKSSDWHSIDNVQTLSQRVNEGPNGSPAVCPGGRYYPYGGEDETYELTFRKKPGGLDAINSGTCPVSDGETSTTIEAPCGAEEAPAPPPPGEVCKLEYTDEIGSFYKNDSGNYCVSDLEGASSGGLFVNRTWTVTQAPTGGEQCMYHPNLQNVGDTYTIPNASPTVANPGYPECKRHEVFPPSSSPPSDPSGSSS